MAKKLIAMMLSIVLASSLLIVPSYAKDGNASKTADETDIEDEEDIEDDDYDEDEDIDIDDDDDYVDYDDYDEYIPKVTAMTQTISAGWSSFAAAIDEDGNLYTWGTDEWNQLGNGEGRRDTSTPLKIMENVASVSCGSYNSAAIKEDGTLWCWGWNRHGGVGHFDSNCCVPVKVMDDVVKVSCGGYHTAALKEDGTMWVWGNDGDGQVGNGEDEGNTNYPEMIMEDVIDIACGDGFTAAVQSDGSLWTWGSNFFGQLGTGKHGHEHSKQSPVKVLDEDVAAVRCCDYGIGIIKTDGSLWMWGAVTDASEHVEPEQFMTDSAADFSLSNTCGFIDTDGKLYMWGSNSNGELGIGTEEYEWNTVYNILDNVTQVSCGNNFVMASLDDGTLLTWGLDNIGQLGIGTEEPDWDCKEFSPVPIEDFVVKQPELFVKKTIKTGVKLDLLRETETLSSGGGFTAAIKPDGSLWVWGSDEWSQLGNGDGREDAYSPIKIMDNVKSVSCGSYHTAVIKEDDSLWGFGWNRHGGLGSMDENTNVPVKIMDDVVKVSCGGYHTGAIKSDGTLWMFGLDDEGQLGNGKDEGSTDVPFKLMDDVIDVACGGGFTLVVNEDGELFSTGANFFGQIGNGQHGHEHIKYELVKIMDDVVSVYAGTFVAAAVKNDGSLWVWGASTSTDDDPIPHKVMDDVVLFSTSSQCGALTNDGTLHMWNGDYSVGNGYEDDEEPVEILLRKQDFTEIACGSDTTAARKNDGTLWIWGRDNVGQLGIGTEEPDWECYSDYPIELEDFIVKAPGGEAYAETVTIEIDGGEVDFPMYTLETLTGETLYYVNINDIASALADSYTSFDTGWYSEDEMYIDTYEDYDDEDVEEPSFIDEDRTYVKFTNPVDVDGELTAIRSIQIFDDDGSAFTYCELEDLAEALDIYINLDDEDDIYIETAEPYEYKYEKVGSATPSTTDKDETADTTDKDKNDGKDKTSDTDNTSKTSDSDKNGKQDKSKDNDKNSGGLFGRNNKSAGSDTPDSLMPDGEATFDDFDWLIDYVPPTEAKRIKDSEKINGFWKGYLIGSDMSGDDWVSLDELCMVELSGDITGAIMHVYPLEIYENGKLIEDVRDDPGWEYTGTIEQGQVYVSDEEYAVEILQFTENNGKQYGYGSITDPGGDVTGIYLVRP